VGANSNIAAGTITCNYERLLQAQDHDRRGRFRRHQFSLVAPVKIGNAPMSASGSVITKDVPDDAMAVEPARRTPRGRREALPRDERCGRRSEG